MRHAQAFCAKVRRCRPRLPDGAMTPAYRGIRPKLKGPAQHGCAGVVSLFSTELTGTTAAMAIAEVMAATVAKGG